MLTIEKLNRALYNRRNKVESFLRLLTYLNSLLAIGLLIYGYGFYLSHATVTRIFGLLEGVVLLFAGIYLCRLLYVFQRKAFLKSTLPEVVLMLLLLIQGSSRYLVKYSLLDSFSQLLGFNHYRAFYEIVSTIDILLLVGIESSKASIRLAAFRPKPAVAFISSFLLIITLGAGLLMLPAMSHTPRSMLFLEALFTATSATCVTGLVVVDTATYFTFKGHLILLLLIQIGALEWLHLLPLLPFF